VKRAKIAVSSTIGVLIFLFVVIAGSSPALATTFVDPINQGNQVSNAISLSQSVFSTAPAAVVTQLDNPSMAVSAGVLANVYGGPLLLTSKSSLTPDVAAELTRLKPSKVYLVGLPASMVSTVKAALPGLTAASQIVVLTGSDCYQTSAMVAREIKAKLGAVSRVVIAPSDNYAAEAAVAALAAGQKWPVLLTPSAGPFPASSAKAITDIGA
jgi:putative cell wall-binding protein